MVFASDVFSFIFFVYIWGWVLMYHLSVLYFYMVKDVYLVWGSIGSWHDHVRFLVQVPQLRCDYN